MSKNYSQVNINRNRKKDFVDQKEVVQEVRKDDATHLAVRQTGLLLNGSIAQQLVEKVEQSTGKIMR